MNVWLEGFNMLNTILEATGPVIENMEWMNSSVSLTILAVAWVVIFVACIRLIATIDSGGSEN